MDYRFISETGEVSDTNSRFTERIRKANEDGWHLMPGGLSVCISPAGDFGIFHAQLEKPSTSAEICRALILCDWEVRR